MSDSPKSQFVGQKDAVAPSPGKVAIYQLETRRRVEVWPVDARELLASGEYVSELPELVAAPLGTDRSPSPSDAELEAQFQAELEAELEAEAKAAAEKAVAEKAAAEAAASAGSGSPETTSPDAPPAGDPPASDAKPPVVPDAPKAPTSTSRRTNRS